MKLICLFIYLQTHTHTNYHQDSLLTVALWMAVIFQEYKISYQLVNGTELLTNLCNTKQFCLLPSPSFISQPDSLPKIWLYDSTSELGGWWGLLSWTKNFSAPLSYTHTHTYQFLKKRQITIKIIMVVVVFLIIIIIKRWKGESYN